MKKSLYFALAASLVAFASCDNEDFSDWAAPTQIENPQGNVDKPDAKVTPLPGIDMELVQDMVTVPLFKVEVSGCTVSSIKVKIFGNEYESDVNGTFLVSDLENAVISAFGRAPETRTVPVEVIGECKTGENVYMFKYPFNLDVTLVAPEIESAYYLIGNMCDWDGSKMLPFTHVGEGNVYDYPTFTTTFECDADCYWKIIGQKGVDAGEIWSDEIGVEIDGDESTEGFLTTTKPGAGKIAEAGKYKLTINMLEGTYTIQKLEFDQYLWVPGNAQGWNPATAGRIESPECDGIYEGFIWVDGGFKFTKAADWNHGDFGCGGDGILTEGGDNHDLGAGLFFVHVDLINMVYTYTKIENMNLVGDFNGWNAADDAQQMTWNAEELCFEITDAGVTSAGWKFTANNGWGINLGGQLDNLWLDGDNITLEGSTIKLYPTRTNKTTIYFTIE